MTHRTGRGLAALVFVLMVGISNADAHPKVAPRSGRDAVEGQWIVVLRDDVDPDAVADQLARETGGQTGERYYHALRGVVLHGSEAAVTKIADKPEILFIQQDGLAYALDRPDSAGNSSNTGSVVAQAQTLPTGIDRVDAELNLNEGAGVGVAIIDTGIQLNHPDLSPIAGQVTFVKGTSSANDDNGHGTHVAGIVAARNNSVGVLGVASSASLYAVKVLNRNGSGTWSQVISGIDWVTKNANQIAVANLSLGGSFTNADDGNCGNTNLDALHRAICKSVDAGVVYVVAAGNSTADAKDFSPAAYDEVITVSALADSDGKPNGTGDATQYGPDDTFATFSNFGQDVDIIAPGVRINSTYIGSAYTTLSGTSMATPHVAGAVALWIAQHGRPVNAAGKVTGNAKDPAVRTLLTGISESVGSFPGDPDGTAEPMLNANTSSVSNSPSSVCCAAK